MSEPQRPASLTDYVQLVRSQRILIGLITIVCAVAAFALAKTSTEIYQAQASLVFQDESVALDVAGTPVAPTSSPDQLAALGAQIAVGSSVLERVKATLTPVLSIAQLTAKVSAAADPSSDLVTIDATDGNPARAAALANAVASATVVQEGESLRLKIKSAVAQLQQRLQALGKSPTDALTRSEYQDEILHLQSVTSIAQPAQISSRAVTPTSAISPRPGRDAAIGAIVGLILGLLVAAVRDATDRRLRGVDRIHDQLNFQLVGAVPRQLLGSAGPGLIEGERKHPPTLDDLECFRILHANFDFVTAGTPARTTLVTSAMPGEGKSTVAAWMALTAAVAGRRTLLVECDLRRPSLANRLGLDSSPGLSDFLAGVAGPSDVLQTVDLAKVMTPRASTAKANGAPSSLVAPGTLTCITAGASRSQVGELLRLTTFAEALGRFNDDYDYVVLDTCPLLPVADTIPILKLVDSVLLCVRDDQTTSAQARRASELIGQVENLRTGLVATGVKPSERDEYGYSAYAYGSYPST